jgi:hypothetical protein
MCHCCFSIPRGVRNADGRRLVRSNQGRYSISLSFAINSVIWHPALTLGLKVVRTSRTISSGHQLVVHRSQGNVGGVPPAGDAIFQNISQNQDLIFHLLAQCIGRMYIFLYSAGDLVVRHGSRRLSLAPSRRRSGSPRRSRSPRGRSRGTRPPWRNPRRSRAAEEQPTQPDHDCSGCCPE